MSLKMILVAALALVMVSCGGSGGGGNAAAQKKSASASFRAISALGPSISSSLLSKNPRLQAINNLTCSSGAGTIESTSSEVNSEIRYALVLKAPGTGCTSGGTTISTPAAGLSMTFTGSGDIDTSFSFTLAINGSATITTGSSTESFTYSNFSIKIVATNTGTAENPVVTATVTFNGSVSSTTDGTQTFNNVVYNSNELN